MLCNILLSYIIILALYSTFYYSLWLIWSPCNYFCSIFVSFSNINILLGISSFSFEIPDKPSSYVRQHSLSYALLLELSKGSASRILFIVCTAIHNCSSSRSLVFATLRQNLSRDNVTNISTITNLYWHWLLCLSVQSSSSF